MGGDEPEAASAPRAGRRARALLALGAAGGLAVAASGLLAGRGAREGQLGPGVVARVNGEPISAEEYERVLAGLARDRREPLAETDKRRILDRLIDEELLVQRGLALGLVRQDRRLRNQLVSQVIDAVVAEATAREPTEAELERFYRKQRDYFAEPGRRRLQQIFVRVRSRNEEAAARERAQAAARRLAAGEPFERVQAALGDSPPVALPDRPLSPRELAERIGPTALRAALELEAGGVSAPVRSALGYRVLRLVTVEPRRVPPFEEIRDRVRAEYLRRAGDRALREYLDRLRREARIVTASELP